MCTVITHPAVPIALSVLLPQDTASSALLLAASVCSIVPDFDVISFEFGVRYGHMFSHRGFTHSIFFAVLFALFMTLVIFHNARGNHLIIFLFLMLSTLSHPVLDAMTNGGLGVGFFAPFSNKRYFFSFRPIEVSPIGFGFFSHRGVTVMSSEIKWVWLPSIIFFVTGHILKRQS